MQMTVVQHKDIPLFDSYYRADRFKAYKGLLNLKCMFCGVCSPIEFDMDLHLYKMYKKNLFSRNFPIRRGIDDRINYFIHLMKQEAAKNGRYFGSGGGHKRKDLRGDPQN